jgi:hypothetical protein
MVGFGACRFFLRFLFSLLVVLNYMTRVGRLFLTWIIGDFIRNSSAARRLRGTKLGPCILFYLLFSFFFETYLLISFHEACGSFFLGGRELRKRAFPQEAQECGYAAGQRHICYSRALNSRLVSGLRIEAKRVEKHFFAKLLSDSK